MAALDLTYRSYQGSGVKFVILGLTKRDTVAHQPRPFTLHLQQFQSYALFGPLQCYERSEKLRTNSNSTPQKSAVYFHPETPLQLAIG